MARKRTASKGASSRWRNKNQFNFSEEKLDQQLNRNIPTAAALSMIERSPVYVTSTIGSFDNIKTPLLAKNELLLKRMSADITQKYLAKAKLLLGVENNIAKYYGPLFGVTTEDRGDFMRALNSFSGTIGKEKLLTVSAEQIVFSMVQNEMTDDPKFRDNVLKRRAKETKLNPNLGSDIEEILNTITSSDFLSFINNTSTMAPVYKKFLNGLEDIKKGTGMSYVVKQGKGFLEEMLAILPFYYLNQQLSSDGPKLSADLKGAITSSTEVTEQITSAIGLLYAGSNLTGGMSPTITTDLSIPISIPGVRALNIDVKSSTSNQYTRNLSFVDNIDNLMTIGMKAGASENDLKMAWVLIMSGLGTDETSKFLANDQLLRPYGLLLMGQDRVVDFIVPADAGSSKNTEFQNVISINRKFYWMSDLVRTIANDLSNYDSSIYKHMLSFNDFGELKSTIDINKKRLYALKRTIVKRKILQNKNYEERLDYMYNVDDKVTAQLRKILKRYENEIRSVSLRAMMKFNVREGG